MNAILRGRALVGDHLLDDAVVTIDGDRVTDVVELPSGAASPAGAETVTGTMVAGYVDQHCHGGGGTAFTDLDADAAAAAARHLHRRGTTSLIASLVTMSPDDLARGVEILADLVDDDLVDGIHLEGPWLAEAQCGAHDPTLLRDADKAEVDRLLMLGRGHIRQVTVAPERERGLDLVRWLSESGVHAAIGHTSAGSDTVRAAVAAGADLATHLFNGMEPWHHRESGAIPVLFSAAASGVLTLELIADGVHLTDDTVRAVIDLVGPEQVSFISDSMAAAGVGDGRFVLGGLPVIVSDGLARLERDPDGTSPGSIAGGTSHVADIVARAVAAGIPLPRAAVSATATPARVLGLDDRGSLRAGSRADLVVLDDDARVTRVMRAGSWLAD